MSRSKTKEKTPSLNLDDDDADDSTPSSDDESVELENVKHNATIMSSSAALTKKNDSHDKLEGEEKKNTGSENDSFDIVLPPLLGSSAGGDCSVMIEVSPEDAALLDYEGISGAIGRFEADDRGIVLDLKGCRYRGSILPGPTAMVIGLSKGGPLRVEAVTNEYTTLVKTQDVMAQLDAVVEGAEMDEGYRVHDENVNRAVKGAGTTPGDKSGANLSQNSSKKGKSNNANSKKRPAPASSTPSKPPTKRRKTSSTKK